MVWLWSWKLTVSKKSGLYYIYYRLGVNIKLERYNNFFIWNFKYKSCAHFYYVTFRELSDGYSFLILEEIVG